MTHSPHHGRPSPGQMSRWPRWSLTWTGAVTGRRLEMRCQAATSSEARADFKRMLRGPLPTGAVIEKEIVE